ncbi:MAG: hypothetical protein ACP5E5_04445 [Acidobacteriaceae bacterium]
MVEIYEWEVPDLPWSEYEATVVVELSRVRCPNCGVKAEGVPQLPSEAPLSKRFEDASGRWARTPSTALWLAIARGVLMAIHDTATGVLWFRLTARWVRPVMQRNSR